MVAHGALPCSLYNALKNFWDIFRDRKTEGIGFHRPFLAFLSLLLCSGWACAVVHVRLNLYRFLLAFWKIRCSGAIPTLCSRLVRFDFRTRIEPYLQILLGVMIVPTHRIYSVSTFFVEPFLRRV